MNRSFILSKRCSVIRFLSCACSNSYRSRLDLQSSFTYMKVYTIVVIFREICCCEANIIRIITCISFNKEVSSLTESISA